GHMGSMPCGTAIRPGIPSLEGAGSFEVNLPPAGRRVELGDQAAHRYLPEVRVPEIFEAVGKGDLQGLGEQVDGGRGTKTHAGDVKFLQEIEDLDDVHAAGTRRADRGDFMPTITPPHGVPALDFVMA